MCRQSRCVLGATFCNGKPNEQKERCEEKTERHLLTTWKKTALFPFQLGTEKVRKISFSANNERRFQKRREKMQAVKAVSDANEQRETYHVTGCDEYVLTCAWAHNGAREAIFL